jgi:hypothetical protein
MAVAFNNFSSVGFDNATTGTLNITASVGNLVLLLLSSDGTAANGTPTFEVPNIWTQLYAPQVDADGSNSGSVYYRVWQTGDDTGQLLTLANAERAVAFAAVYTGIDTSNPIDSSAVDANNTAGTNLILPTNFTPTSDNCMVVGFLALESGNAGGAVITSWPTGTGTFNERADNVGGPPGTGAQSASGAFADYLQTTAGSMGATPTAVTSGGSTTYAGFWIAINEDANALSVDTISDSTLDLGQTGITLTGSNFGAVQGTVEIGDSVSYSAATKITQTVTNWNTNGQSITFNFVRNSGATYLPQGDLYVFVTNDGATQQGSIPASFGRVSYLNSIEADLGGRQPDILHILSSDLRDVYNGFNATQSNGAETYTGTGLCRDTVASWSPNTTSAKIEISNGTYTNTTPLHGERLIFGWIRFPNQYSTPTLFFEEGGGVNNIYLALGFGGRLLANYADSNQDGGIGTQAISDFNLSPNRAYHIAVQFDFTLGTGNNFVKCFIDGIEQNINSLEVSITGGTIQNVTNQSSHSGDYGYGASNGNLDTGGTDINYPAALNSQFNFWGTYCEGSNGRTSGDPPTGAQLKTTFFNKGVVTVDDIFSDSTLNMQAFVEANIDDTDYGDVPAGVLVERVTGGGNLALTMTNVTFDDRASVHVKFLGTAGETLTILNAGGGILQSKCIAPYGGAVVVNNTNNVTITGIENGSTVYVFDGPLPTDNTIAFTTSSTGNFTFSTVETSITIAVVTLTKGVIRRENVAVSSNTIIPFTQSEDNVYDNPV